MTSQKRLAVCYVVPGHHLLRSAGPTRNVLNLAKAMAAFADVTVAFRRVIDADVAGAYDTLEIEPGRSIDTSCIDDAAMRSIRCREFVTYLRALRRFSTEQLKRFDVVLEKSWLLSGYVSAMCRRQGIPALVVENLVPVMPGPVRSHRELAKSVRLWVARGLAGRYLRQARLIIAETESLKSAMTKQWRIPGQRIEVVGLGVDRETFHPIEQRCARQQLGIPLKAMVLLYAGVIDKTHNLAPVIDALIRLADQRLQLHIIGDGALRASLEQRAREGEANVFFHGRVSYQRVPVYIGAADLCLAPYEPSLFPDGQVAYSSLKIPEYMSAGRPVVSVPSGRILELVEDGVTGFLFDNNTPAWCGFLQRLPTREQLRCLGQAARGAHLASWEDTARAYWTLCTREVAQCGAATKRTNSVRGLGPWFGI